MVSVKRVSAEHADALLRFELENRAYFARVIPDRGDAYFAEFADRHAAVLAMQDAGTDHFHVLVDDGQILGRVNLVNIVDGSAELGYRIAESAAGRGLATWGVREVLGTPYGLRQITARTTLDNLASQKILARVGFVRTGEVELSGQPGYSYVLATPQA
ncbi:GNAT family N-acetyltransferase [Kribbella italica]|uniref:Ribosomal-protein-alanine N-acetyltransferase n=1 Tax=Kribbella italica TaxID=1540520 RepID=A0A7W9MY31_9ACTN|nr:GNAT family N-acetyltransferase [Kribbella italica]MBB5839972.1 ribosomal-protein-alanine N-acetyltransferase [Kribbella italica]